MRQCQTCKYWQRFEQWCIDIPEYWGNCVLGNTKDGDPEYSKTLAMAVDYEGYQAYLHTHEQFGCMQWEAKENA